MKFRRHFLIGWMALSGLVLLWVRGTPALAHAVLLAADPAPNAILETAPGQVRILFTEPVVPAFSRIAVLTQTGQRVDKGDLKVDNEAGTALVVTLPPLDTGTYLVGWEVLSTVDGHTTSGSFPFGVGVSQLATAPGSVTTTAQQPTPFSVGARWFNLTGLALLLGLFAFRLLVWNPTLIAVELDETDRQLDLSVGRASLKIGALGVALVGLALALTLVAQAGQYDLLNFNLLKTWLGTRFGSMWFLRFWIAVATGFVIADLSVGLKEGHRGLRGWEWWAGLIGAIGLGLATSLVSHSAALAENVQQAIAVDALHVLAAGVWAGGLVQLGLSLWQARHLPKESRDWLNLYLTLNFSALAASAVGFLLVSGGYLAWKHVGSWTALFGTAYGLSLLTKIALALPAFGIAAINLLIVKPKLEAAVDTPEADSTLSLQRRFVKLVRTEAVFAVLVLAAAGLLTDLQRGQDAPLLAGQVGKVTLTQTVEDLNITLTLEPALVGQNTFDVYLTNANNQPVADAKEVSLRFTFLGQSIGTAKVEAASSGDGHYRLDGGYLSLVGPWQVELAVRRSGAFDVFAPFRLEAGLNGAIQPTGGQANLIERLAEFLTRSSGSVTGVFLVLFAIGWLWLATRAVEKEWHLVPLFLPALVAFAVGGVQLFTFFREFTPARFTTNPILPDAASIARGKELYAANCLACHGPEGRGDGELAISLSITPADFTAGHTETHPDGDVYYWIKQGIPNSAMPAFSEKLSDEEIWHLVNYIRRLSAQGYEAPATPDTPSPSSAAGGSDPKALKLLQQVDAAMNQLQSLRAVEVLRDDSGHSLTTTLEYMAPNQASLKLSTGAESIAYGPRQFARGVTDKLWQTWERPEPYAFPDFDYSRQAIQVQLAAETLWQGESVQVLAFVLVAAEEQFDFRLYVDPETHLIRRLTMDGPGHHMVTDFVDYAPAVTITPPPLDRIAPTPTAILLK